jgi:hypothetical protein
MISLHNNFDSRELPSVYIRMLISLYDAIYNDVSVIGAHLWGVP